MVTLPVSQTSTSGLAISTTTLTVGSNDFDNTTGRVFLYVDNSGGVSPVTLGFTTTGSVGGVATESPKNETVAAGAIEVLGPFATSAYNNSSDVTTFTSDTAVGAMAFRS